MRQLGQQVARARPVPVQPPAVPAPPWLVHVGVTDDAGRVTWQLPEGQFVTAPVVAATPVTPDLGSTVSYSTVIEQATPGLVVVRVWQTRTLLGLGLLPTIPARAGIVVHLYATTPPAAPSLPEEGG